MKEKITKLSNKENEFDHTTREKVSTSTFQFPPINSQSKIRSKKGTIGPLLIAIVTAILIGMFFGFVMLNMFTNKKVEIEPSDNISKTIHADLNETDTDTKASSETTLEEMTASVLQIGVFSERENADAWSKSYQSAGYSSVVFERDKQFFLFAGIAPTEEKAKEFAAILLEDKIDVYVKDWETKGIDTKLTTEEHKWLHSFQAEWKVALHSLNDESEILFDKWHALTKNYPLQSEKAIELVGAIEVFLENEKKASNSFELQNDLLNLWQIYEELFIDN